MEFVAYGVKVRIDFDMADCGCISYGPGQLESCETHKRFMP